MNTLELNRQGFIKLRQFSALVKKDFYRSMVLGEVLESLGWKDDFEIPFTYTISRNFTLSGKDETLTLTDADYSIVGEE